MLLKNGQNPSVGTIVASMHPAYQFKTWGRDGTFAAMILDAAGFHAEAELYLRWMSTAEVRCTVWRCNLYCCLVSPYPPWIASSQLRDGGGFHTCYSVWTGEVVMFVEPQYDSTGEFPMAVLHHILVHPDPAFLDATMPRVRELLQFFVENVRLPAVASVGGE